jgi:hypothetical protein
MPSSESESFGLDEPLSADLNFSMDFTALIMFNNIAEIINFILFTIMFNIYKFENSVKEEKHQEDLNRTSTKLLEKKISKTHLNHTFRVKG